MSSEFQARLDARNPRDPLEELARAALRLLPAALAVGLLLAWMAVGPLPWSRPVTAAGHPDLVRWVRGAAEDPR